MFEKKTVSHDRNTQVFPLLVVPTDDGGLFGETPRSNWSHTMQASWKSLTGTDIAVPENATQPLQYTYAVLHSPAYRERYFSFLRADFPHIPFPASAELLNALSGLGAELMALHLLESPVFSRATTTYAGPASPEVARVGWSDDTVWLDAAATKGGRAVKPGTIGFRCVTEEVSNFHIGGYQVCEKWLKDRKGRALSPDDISHYQKIVVALSETIRLMGQIDDVIDEHGGWPSAFATSAAE